MQYNNVGIPKTLSASIEKIMYVLGYRSLSEFVVEATREHLHRKQIDYDRKMIELAKEKQEMSI